MFTALNLSTSELSNLSEKHTVQDLTHNTVKVSIIIVLGTMVTLGNIAVLLVISTSVSGWSRNSRYFLLSLTVADSAFGLLVMPLNIGVSLLKDYTKGPDTLCHIVAFCNSTVYSTCMYTLATITLERYIAVFYPLRYSSLITRKRTLLLIAFAWCVPPFLLLPISFPNGVIEVQFSPASLVCNPSYSTNVGYTLSLSCFIFFPCSIVMTYGNLRLWCAAKRQTLKLRKFNGASGSRPKVAAKVLVPVMAAYYTCWTPCIAVMLYDAISGSSVPEWLEFVAVWLPTCNGFLNCIFYFWINQCFRKKFYLVFQSLHLAECPAPPTTLGYCGNSKKWFVLAMGKNNSVHEHLSNVSPHLHPAVKNM